MYVVYIRGRYDSEEVKEQREKLSYYISRNDTKLFYDYTDLCDDTTHSNSCSQSDQKRVSYDYLVGKSGKPFIQGKDSLVISSLDILGDTYNKIIKELKYLSDKNINIIVYDFSVAFDEIIAGNQFIDVKTASIIAILSNLADTQGKKPEKRMGRPRLQCPKNFDEVYKRVYIDKEITVKEALELLNITRTKFYHFKKEYEVDWVLGIF